MDSLAAAPGTGPATSPLPVLRKARPAARRAVAAATLSTRREGAREGMPTAAELDEFLAVGPP